MNILFYMWCRGLPWSSGDLLETQSLRIADLASAFNKIPGDGEALA